MDSVNDKKIGKKIGETIDRNVEKVRKTVRTGETEGIHCDVGNCVYHEPEAKCSAGKIYVGPAYAASESETNCSTFRKK